MEEIRAAVSALTRTPAPMFSKRGAARTLLLRSCRLLTRISTRRIAEAVGVHPMTVRRAGHEPMDPGVRMVARVLGDPRFTMLTADELPWLRRRP